MEIKTPAEHIGLLTLMMLRVVMKRLQELGQLDDATVKHLHHLVSAMKKHATLGGGHELDVLLGELEGDFNTERPKRDNQLS